MKLDLQKIKKMKKQILIAISLIIILLSITLLFKYIDILNNKAYSSWIENWLNILMNQIKNNKCTTIIISNGSEKIELLNVKCLKNIPKASYSRK